MKIAWERLQRSLARSLAWDSPLIWPVWWTTALLGIDTTSIVLAASGHGVLLFAKFISVAALSLFFKHNQQITVQEMIILHFSSSQLSWNCILEMMYWARIAHSLETRLVQGDVHSEPWHLYIFLFLSTLTKGELHWPHQQCKCKKSSARDKYGS